MERWRLIDDGILITSEEEQIKVAFWPNLTAGICGPEGHDELWGEVWPEMRLIYPKRRKRRARWVQTEFPFDDERRPTERDHFRAATEGFRASLPSAVARAVEPFHWGQWELIRACRDAPRFLDLIRSNRILAMQWLLSEPDEFTDPDELHAASGTPQRDLLEELGAEGRKSTLRILRRIPAATFDEFMQQLLADLLIDDEALKRLRHLPRVGRGVIALAASPHLLDLCSPKLLLEVAQTRSELMEAATACALIDYVSNCEKLGVEPKRFDYRYEVERDTVRSRFAVYDAKRAGTLATKRRQRRVRHRPFPRPPFPGTKSIQPISSREQLEAEGQQQGNCLERGRSADRYARQIATKRYYLYRVTWPQRCTLLIGRRRCGVWERMQLLAGHNRPASRATKKHIEKWLASTQPGEPG